MNKTLILTGWSKTVYMTAAAAAIEALKWKADVAGVSMDALVGALKDRAPNYKTVFVLGVGLKKNISQTISTLMELKTKGAEPFGSAQCPSHPLAQGMVGRVQVLESGKRSCQGFRQIPALSNNHPKGSPHVRD